MNQKSRYIINTVILASLVMAIVEVVIVPSYVIKSLTKLVLFIAIPLSYAKIFNDNTFKDTLKTDKKSFIFSLLLGLALLVLIMGTYFFVGQFYDFASLDSGADDPSGINPSNFIYVALYITLINSFLEEFFFRGFAFGTLKTVFSRRSTYFFSSFMFALYHVALVVFWLPPVMTIIAIIALFITGLVLNKLYEKSNSLIAPWFVHLFANIPINTITYFIYC